MSNAFGRRQAISLVVLGLLAGAAHAAKPPGAYCGAGAANCADVPFAGAIDAASGSVWVHLNTAASTRVRYRPADAKDWKKTPSVVPDAAAGNTTKFALAGLAAGTTYGYQVGIVQADGSETWSQSWFFRTRDADPASLRFAVMADFANKLVASPALRTASAEPNDLMLFIGDMDHRNPAAEPNGQGTYPTGAPEVLADMRAMHQDMRKPSSAIGADFNTGLLASTATHPQTPFYYAWDDHDYCSNNQDVSCQTRDIAIQAYRENYLWAPDSAMSPANPCNGDFQRISWGGVADLFLLDARSDRVTSGPDATLLGACQLDWLMNALRQSTATWKFIMSPVPFNTTTKSYDSWGLFPAERQRILDRIALDGVANVLVVSGDIHSGGAYDDGVHSGLPEFSTPHANMPSTWVNTFCRPFTPNKKNGYVADEPGTWTVGSLVPANTVPVTTCLGSDYPGKPAVVSTGGPYPLDGVGAPGFVRVEASKRFATITVVGFDGQIRTGVTADGTTSPLQRTFVAQ